MVTEKIIKNFFIIWVIFFLLNTSSLGFNSESSKGDSRQEDPIPYVFGQMGENQWYISAVTVGFDYDPERVAEIHYSLDDIWYVYTSPFNIIKDGYYNIQWFWVDPFGRPHNGLDIVFKVDQTPPTIKLTKKSGGKNKMIFTANAIDEVSQVERVEFYLDDVLQETVNESPFQYTWTGEVNQWVYAIGYNFAGLSQKSSNLSTPRIFLKNNCLIQRLVMIIQTMLSKLK